MKIYKFVKSGHTVKSYKSINNQTPKSKSAKLKNLFLMGSPVLISSIGIFISLTPYATIRTGGIITVIILTIVAIAAIIYYNNEDNKTEVHYKKLECDYQSLIEIMAHMDNQTKTSAFTVAAFSKLSEDWASTINSFAYNVQNNGCVSNKAWNKDKIIDSICVHCRDMIQQYCGKKDNSKISVNVVTLTTDEKGEQYVQMTSHSSPMSMRPRACKKKERLKDSLYYYAKLIRYQFSDLDIAINNEEILQRFEKVSRTTDLSKYTQYIAVPLYCKGEHMLGVLQIVTKHDYIIENNKITLEKFVNENVIPYSNLVILVEKIYNGLYATPTTINKEV